MFTFLPDEFAAFTPMHAAVVVVSAILTTITVTAGRRWRRVAPARERRLRVGLAAFVILVQLFSLGYWLRPERYDTTISLPLHVCDLVPWLGAVVLLVGPSRWPAAAGLAYFWGIGLSGWGFLWPVLQNGPATVHFWLFWIVHLQIVGIACYLVFASDWRPTRRDLRIAAGCTLAYAIAITPVNLALASDYGYVGPGDGPASLVGPWPWRVAIIVLGQILLFTMLWWPWRRGGAV